MSRPHSCICRWAARAAMPPLVCARQPASPRTRSCSARRPCSADPAAQLGIQMRNGIKAYFDYVNEKGGVHGRKLELVTEDDHYEPSVAPVGDQEADRGAQGVRAARLRRHADRGRRTCRWSTQAKVPLVGMFTGAEVAARAVQPLRVPRARELLRRDREDRRAGGLHRRQEDLGVLPGRRLRRGRAARAPSSRSSRRSMKIHSHGTVERNTRQGRGRGRRRSTPRSPTRW